MITVSHPWHGVSYGQSAPRIVNAIIEIPQGSRAKYEIDKESGLLKLDRVIYSSFYYAKQILLCILRSDRLK